MAGREEVIKAVEYLNWYFTQDDGTADENAVKAWKVLSREQKPRVMTLEEVIAHYSLPPVFVDDFKAQIDYYEDIQPLYFEFPNDNENWWIMHWRGYELVACYLDEWKYSYNKKWRCWTSRPTDEQKEATPWES